MEPSVEPAPAYSSKVPPEPQPTVTPLATAVPAPFQFSVDVPVKRARRGAVSAAMPMGSYDVVRNTGGVGATMKPVWSSSPESTTLNRVTAWASGERRR